MKTKDDETRAAVVVTSDCDFGTRRATKKKPDHVWKHANDEEKGFTVKYTSLQVVSHYES